MSQGQFSERIFGEPRDGIMFVWRNVDRRPRPRFDQPDLHVERVAMNFLHGRARRRRDVDAEFLSKLSDKCQARQFPGLHVPTGQVPDVGIPMAPGRSVTQQNPLAVPQQRRDDASLRRAFHGDRHRRIVPGRTPSCPSEMRTYSRSGQPADDVCRAASASAWVEESGSIATAYRMERKFPALLTDGQLAAITVPARRFFSSR